MRRGGADMLVRGGTMLRRVEQLFERLAHLIRPSRSSDLWSEVDIVLADYGERKEWLRGHGAGMGF